MNLKDPKNSVREEQFGHHAENNVSESEKHQKAENQREFNENEVSDPKKEKLKEKPSDIKLSLQRDQAGTKEPGGSAVEKASAKEDVSGKEDKSKKEETPSENESSSAEIKEEDATTGKIQDEEDPDTAQQEKTKDDQNKSIGEQDPNLELTKAKEEVPEKKSGGKDQTVDEDSAQEKTSGVVTEKKSPEKENKPKELVPGNLEDEESKKDSPKHENDNEETINYHLLSKPDLVKLLEELVNNKNVNDIKDEVESIKTAFYKKHQEETEKQKAELIEKGIDTGDFEPGEDPDEIEFRDLLRKYRDLRSDYEKLLEDEKDINLRKKYEIIDEIKDLINRDESINKTFQEFRDLQKRWHEIGIVPQKELKNLWETYHYHVEKFYDYIKINKELRDLDLKKNLEAKLELCEKAESLLLEPNIVSAFQTLQRYHDQWREIGPVPKDKRTELWERFREATAKINKKHQQYYQDLKETQRKNLESKSLLCEKAEQMAESDFHEHDQWVKKTKELLELQKVWKTIGFAPKKDNNKIYARFRAACDLFFEKKREFYAQNMEEQQKNMQQKLDLCVQAEALQESEDWRNTTDELIKLQKKWKKIGPVPRKHSDELWKRFRAACDRFFNRKSEFFSKIDTTYEKNLDKKKALIKDINEFQLGDNLKQNLKKLNDFQRRWSEIGFVPIQKKDEIMQSYREAINHHYDNLEMDDYKKNMLKFRNKVDNIRQKPRSDIKLRFEREKLMNKLQQLKSDIGTWENNIGFFADSKNADSMVRDFEKKIKSAKDKIKLLEDKIILIDEIDNEE